MLEFILKQNVNLVFGPGTIGKLGELLNSIGKKKPMIATDKGIVGAGIYDKVAGQLKKSGIEFAVFDSIKPDAPASLVEEGYETFKREKCDSVIAVGGGSTLDTSKAINMLQYNEGPIMKYTAGPDAWAMIKPSPGLIAIPTTAGTGSEMSDGIILIDEKHMKQTILSQNVLPEYAILDAELLIGTPPHIVASTGVDALSHLVEGYLNNLATDMSDIICLGGAKTMVEALPIAFNNPQDIASRSKMMACSTLGGWMLANVHTNSGHSISHVLGSMFGMPHGFGCAYALPSVTAFNAIAMPERVKKIGELFGIAFTGSESPEEIGIKVRDAMEHFRDDILKLKPIREFGIDCSRLPEAAERVTKEAFQLFNPREMSKEQALELLEYIVA